MFAKDENPLTHLPGNNRLRKELEQIHNYYDSMAIVYIDIVDFKPFNDTFGFELGDEIIKFVGNYLRKYFNKNYFFVSHIGGDDFILLIKKRSLFGILKFLLILQKEFRNYLRKKLIFEKDVYQETYVALNLYGNMQEFNLPMLSAGILFYKEANLELQELTKYIAFVKNKSKMNHKKIHYYIFPEK